MITELLLDFWYGLLNFVVDMLPTSEPPAWLDDGSTYLAQIWGYGAGLGAWIPWALVSTVFSALMVCLGIALVAHVVRIVASYATLGGGAT